MRMREKARMVCGARAVALMAVMVILLGILTVDGALQAGNATAQPQFLKTGPITVQFGPQPEGWPLVLWIEPQFGGEISQVSIDLGEMVSAAYYDPVAHSVQIADIGTPMQRVYQIDGEDAYLVKTGAKHSDNEYRMAVTHERVKDVAVATHRWQVELPDVGTMTSMFELKVTAANESGQQSSTTISVRVVDDQAAPDIVAGVSFSINSPVTRLGDAVRIEADITEELSGIFSVTLAENTALPVFGEGANLVLTRRINSGIWEVENMVASNVLPGVYVLEVVAMDWAGNERISVVAIEVAKEIPSLEIELKKGWNLISVPMALKDPAVNEVFAGLPVESVQTVIEGERIEPSGIEPGYGYLVQATEDAVLTVEFVERDPSALPLMLTLKPGWNLIGYASESLEPMMPLTFYLGSELKDEWMIVYTGDGAQARMATTEPYVWATDSFPTITGEPFSEDEDNLPIVELGKGYWIYLTGKGVLVP